MTADPDLKQELDALRARIAELEQHRMDLEQQRIELEQHSPLMVFRRVLAELEMDSQRPTEKHPARRIEPCPPDASTRPPSIPCPPRPIRSRRTLTEADFVMSSEERMELRKRARLFEQRQKQPKPGKSGNGSSTG